MGPVGGEIYPRIVFTPIRIALKSSFVRYGGTADETTICVVAGKAFLDRNGADRFGVVLLSEGTAE